MLVSTYDQLFAVGTLVNNINNLNPSLFDNIIVYIDQIDDKIKDKFLKFDHRIVFKRYSQDDFFKDHGFNKEQIRVILKERAFLRSFSYLSIIKYKIFEELRYFKKIIFLDTDIVIKKDFSELFNYDGVAYRDGNLFKSKFESYSLSKRKFSDFLNDKQIKSGNAFEFKSPNGGLIYATDAIDYLSFYNEAKEFVANNLIDFNGVIDELAISYPLLKNNYSPLLLDAKIYNVLPEYSVPESKIIHFIGPRKPWSDSVSQLLFSDWATNFVEFSKSINIDDLSSKVQLFSVTDFYKEFVFSALIFDFLIKSKIHFDESYRIVSDLKGQKLIISYNIENIYFECSWAQNFLSDKRVNLSAVLIGYFCSSTSVVSDINKFINDNPKLLKAEFRERTIKLLFLKRISNEEFVTIFKWFSNHLLEILRKNLTI